MIRVSMVVRRPCLSPIFALALLLAALSPHPSRAADPGTGSQAAIPIARDLQKIALTLYPADEIIGNDRSGDYRLPEGPPLASAVGARVLLQLAALSGDPTDHELVGIMIESGAGGPRDYAAARAHYRLSGNRAALWRLGLLVYSGKGGPADLPAARAIFRRSADLGLIDSKYEYARMLELGEGGERNEAEARRIYESTLEYCHGDIANRLAMMLMRGVGGPVDVARAAAMHLKAVSCHNQFYEDPVVIGSPDLLDPPTIAEIQKLLKKRGAYRGPVTGRLDETTRRALDHSWGV
jgi:TPR repeat protein